MSDVTKLINESIQSILDEGKVKEDLVKLDQPSAPINAWKESEPSFTDQVGKFAGKVGRGIAKAGEKVQPFTGPVALALAAGLGAKMMAEKIRNTKKKAGGVKAA